MSVLTYLSDEHRMLLPLIVDVQQAAEAKDRAALKIHLTAAWDALTKDLDAHMALEEEVAFPSMSRALGEGLLKPFQEEHREIRALRDLLLEWAAAGKVPADLCLILCNLIVAHIQREELMLFPSACEVLDLVGSLAYRKTSGKALVIHPRDEPPCLFGGRQGEGHRIVLARA